MAKETLFEAGEMGRIRGRVARLTPEAEARFGRMNAHQMVCHLSDAFRGTLGEIRFQPRGNWFDHTIRKRLALSSIPFPRGKIVAPPEVAADVDGTRPVAWADDLAALHTLLERFAALPPDHAFPPHPFLGPLTHAEWGRFHRRHVNHHLLQFGV